MRMGAISPFHLAIPVQNLEECAVFYTSILECAEGRRTDYWVDLDLYGHQLVLHQKDGFEVKEENPSNEVDGHDIPIPHFGVVLDWAEWQDLAERMRSMKVRFVVEPYIRFEGEVGEQATMFFLDPENNALEFKAFKNIDQLFAK